MLTELPLLYGMHTGQKEYGGFFQIHSSSDLPWRTMLECYFLDMAVKQKGNKFMAHVRNFVLNMIILYNRNSAQ